MQQTQEVRDKAHPIASVRLRRPKRSKTALHHIVNFAKAVYQNYIFRRFVLLLVVLWLANTAIFFLPRLSGQDPVLEKLYQDAQRGGHLGSGVRETADAYRERFGLDNPLIVQYGNFLVDLVRLDLGPSISYFPRTVWSIIGDSILWTIGLLGVVTLMAFALGSLAGALLAWPRAPKFLGALFMPLLTLSAVPQYLVGLILIYLLAFQLPIFPVNGGHSAAAVPNLSLPFILDVLRHAILPGIALILSAIGFWAIGMRGIMVSTQGEDYMLTAEAKGLKPTRIFFRYGIRNALLPQVTGLAIAYGTVITGAVLVERLFSYPGLGNTLFQAIRLSDFFMIRGIVTVIILGLALATFLLDVLYPIIDPRVKYSKG